MLLEKKGYHSKIIYYVQQEKETGLEQIGDEQMTPEFEFLGELSL